jgi:hypothetical protein
VILRPFRPKLGGGVFFPYRMYFKKGVWLLLSCFQRWLIAAAATAASSRRSSSSSNSSSSSHQQQFSRL